MSKDRHLLGHRPERVRFRDRTVECSCGAIVTCADDESAEIRNAALRDAFADHRREATAKERMRSHE